MYDATDGFGASDAVDELGDEMGALPSGEGANAFAAWLKA